jgi:2-oxoglutarate dehydrogenase complex dehydrogenase (E1) component-like enzyme
MKLFPGHEIRYVGRGPSASPATGSPGIHREEQAALVNEALTIE